MSPFCDSRFLYVTEAPVMESSSEKLLVVESSSEKLQPVTESSRSFW